MKLKSTIILLIAVLNIGCGDGYEDCSEDSIAVIQMRSLTESQLEILYQDMKSLMLEKEYANYGLGSNIPIPISLEKYNFQSIVDSGNRNVIAYLLACNLDNKVALIFTFSESEKDKISLQWGEGGLDNGAEIIWQEA